MNGFPYPGEDHSFPSLGSHPQVQEQFKNLLRGLDSRVTTKKLCELARTLPGWEKASGQGLGKTFSSLVKAGVLQDADDGSGRVFWLKNVPKPKVMPVVVPPPPPVEELSLPPEPEPVLDPETRRLDRLKKLYAIFPSTSFQQRQVEHEKIGLDSGEDVIKFLSEETRKREYLMLASPRGLGQGPKVHFYSWVQNPNEVRATLSAPPPPPVRPAPPPPPQNDQLQELFTKVATLEAQAAEHRQFLVDQAIRACETVLASYPPAIRSAALAFLASTRDQ